MGTQCTINLADLNNTNTPFLSARGLELARHFGLPIERQPAFQPAPPRPFSLSPGQIVYLTGPSGSGKSLTFQAILRHLHTAWPDPRQLVDLNAISIPSGAAPADCFNHLPLDQALQFLTLAGLSEPAVWLRPNLSVGELDRLRLARAMSFKPAVICADEFAASLDLITAAGLCHRIRQWSRRSHTRFILASHRDDLIDDLQPDTLIRRYPNGQSQTSHHQPKNDP